MAVGSGFHLGASGVDIPDKQLAAIEARALVRTALVLSVSDCEDCNLSAVAAVLAEARKLVGDHHAEATAAISRLARLYERWKFVDHVDGLPEAAEAALRALDGPAAGVG